MMNQLLDFYKHIDYIKENGERMAFTHQCKTCGKTIKYEKAEELKEHFYFKAGYFRNECKDCEKKIHAIKYKEGKYNYRAKKDNGYDNTRVFGGFNREE